MEWLSKLVRGSPKIFVINITFNITYHNSLYTQNSKWRFDYYCVPLRAHNFEEHIVTLYSYREVILHYTKSNSLYSKITYSLSGKIREDLKLCFCLPWKNPPSSITLYKVNEFSFQNVDFMDWNSRNTKPIVWLQTIWFIEIIFTHQIQNWRDENSLSDWR